MNFNEYQDQALTTAIFPKEVAFIYLPLKLVGEAGEVAEKFGKHYRKNGLTTIEANSPQAHDLLAELGDVLWYIAVLANELGYSLEQVASMNINKLKSRQLRGVLEGNGDNR